MSAKENAVVDAMTGILARSLDALEVLRFIGTALHPQHLTPLVEVLGDSDAALRAAMSQFAAITWPEHLQAFQHQASDAAEATLQACEGIRAAAQAGPAGYRQALRALRRAAQAQEALYPLAVGFPTVSRFFLPADRRDDKAMLDRLAAGAARDGVAIGIQHSANALEERGGFSVYVPEDHDPGQPAPLVMALHGGSGHGRIFLWSWLREARSRGAILVTPTATGDTWSLMEPDQDGAHLAAVLAKVSATWPVDRSRVLLTGMSDGGTFTLVSGVQKDSPFTHLAPIAASFHPSLLTMAPPQRLHGLPIYLAHGALDWMFPVAVARTAHVALDAAGARVTYRELPEQSHAFPSDEAARIVDWFLTS